MTPVLNKVSEATLPSSSGGSAAWSDEDQKIAYRHMRVTYKSHSRAVRVLVLQECLKDTPAEAGLERLLACIDSKLSLA